MNLTRRFITILLLLVLLLGGMSVRNYETRKDLIYAEALDKVAVTVDGRDLTLEDMAFYVAYQEKEVQSGAVIYNREKPLKYWNAHTNGFFVRSLAEESVVDMAVHDEIFYRIALDAGIMLDEREEAYLANEVYDFCSDLTETQFEKLGVTAEKLEESMRKIALANKYQSILTQMEGVDYTTYNYTEAAYEELLMRYEVVINESVWDRISVGNITVN